MLSLNNSGWMTTLYLFYPMYTYTSLIMRCFWMIWSCALACALHAADQRTSSGNSLARRRMEQQEKEAERMRRIREDLRCSSAEKTPDAAQVQQLDQLHRIEELLRQARQDQQEIGDCLSFVNAELHEGLGTVEGMNNSLDDLLQSMRKEARMRRQLKRWPTNRQQAWRQVEIGLYSFRNGVALTCTGVLCLGAFGVGYLLGGHAEDQSEEHQSEEHPAEALPVSAEALVGSHKASSQEQSCLRGLQIVS